MNTRQIQRRAMKAHFEGMHRNIEWVLKHCAGVESTMTALSGLGDGSQALTDEQVQQLPNNWRVVVQSLREIGAALVGLEETLATLRKQV